MLGLLLVLVVEIECGLIQVAHLFRHGARYPLYAMWDGDEQKSNWGRILPSGIRQHYNLGRMLRKEYIEELEFLSTSYDPTEFYIKSTDVDRTIASAQSQLMGMYPESVKTNQKTAADKFLPPYLGSQDFVTQDSALPFDVNPIPIRIEPYNYQVLSPNCLASRQLLAEDFQTMSAMIQDFEDKTAEVRYQLCEAFSVEREECTNSYTIYQLYDVYQSDIYQGRYVPELSEDEFNMFQLISSFSFYSYAGGRRYASYMTQPFFSELIDKFTSKAANPSMPLKWISYSAHDGNIVRSARYHSYFEQSVLNISSPQCLYERLSNDYSKPCQMQPKFATNIIFELYEDDLDSDKEKYFVKIKYDGKYQMVCDDSFQCPLSTFVDNLTRIIPSKEDFQQICNNLSIDPFTNSTNPQRKSSSRDKDRVDGEGDNNQNAAQALKSISNNPSVVIVNNNMILNLRNYEE